MKPLFLFLAFVFSTGMCAQSDSIKVKVRVIDALTGGIVEDGEVELLAPDSTLLGKGRMWYNTANGKRVDAYAEAKAPGNGKYLLRVRHKNYREAYMPVTVKLFRRNTGEFTISDFLRMYRLRKEEEQQADRQLGEAVVKATKIKMVMKGDTIVYNADAFQLSQGSMLDALIERLPGVELKENGVITVNGETVSSLLVNGKDFFRGDARMALDNLPAFMVDKVKVYKKETDFERLTGRRDDNRPTVVDVNLKKQYSVGWIANAEAAYGTEEKFLGRIFAMRFTDCSRTALFGNINNTNDTRKPGRQGDWTPSYLPYGIQTSKTAGAEYYYENRERTFEWTSDLQASHTKNHTLTRTSGESFLPAGQAFTQRRYDSHDRSAAVGTKHSFKRMKSSYHEGSLSVNYDRNSYRSQSLEGEFGRDPYSFVADGVLDSLFLPGGGPLRQAARYRRSSEARGRGENWSLRAPYNMFFLPFKKRGLGDMIMLDLAGSYDKHSSHAFDNYFLEYFGADSPDDDFRNRYTARPSRHYRYEGDLGYSMVFGKLQNLNVAVYYGYLQDYRSGREDLFRLDRLEGWGPGSDHGLGTLPSAADALQQALDVQNSEHSELWLRDQQARMQMRYQYFNNHLTTTVWLTLPVVFRRERLRYERCERNFDLRRHKVLVMPSAALQQDFRNERIMTTVKLDYGFSRRLPGLTRTIDLANDADPLYIQLGNPSLRPADDHSLNLGINSFNSKTFRQLYHLDFSYRRTRRELAFERTYNPATGGYTVRPVNVDGNWRTDGSLELNRMFGKEKRFTWGNRTSYSFDHNVDMANVDGAEDAGPSTIRNLYLREQLTLDYARNGWTVGAKVRGSYNRLSGKRSDFNGISAWDYSYGLTAHIPLPGGIGVHTDFTVFCRRGYEDPALNTDDFVWNIRLERSVMNGNLTFMVDGFDILHELSKVTRTVNAQGRTESYTNVMPSYFMAHIIYRLNRQPKKKSR